MKIVLLGNSRSIHVERHAIGLHNMGHEIYLLSMQPKNLTNIKVYDITNQNSVPNIRLIRPIMEILHSIVYLRKIRKIVKNIQPDIVYAHYLTDYGILGSQLNVHPYVIKLEGSDLLLAPKKFGTKHISSMKNAFSKADRILIPALQMKDRVKEFGVDESLIEYIPNAVDIQQFYPQIGPNIVKLKNKLGLMGYSVGISTRALEPVYNIDCLLQAIPIVTKNVPRAKFIILGSGSLQTYLKNKVRALDISEYVYFAGHVSHVDVAKYMNIADIYVSTSISDSLSVAALEAAACGLVLALSDIPANRELLNNDVRCSLFENNPQSLAQTLIYCLMNLHKMKKEALERNIEVVKQKYGWTNYLTRLENLFLSLCT